MALASSSSKPAIVQSLGNMRTSREMGKWSRQCSSRASEQPQPIFRRYSGGEFAAAKRYNTRLCVTHAAPAPIPHGGSMQYIYTMNGVSKTVPPKRQIIKDISLSFFPGAKIGLLGLNGAGKSTVLKIMAGVDTDFEGEARPQAGIKVGYLAQEPEMDPTQTVRQVVEEGVGEILKAQEQLDAVYAAYAEEGADFEKLAEVH